MALATDSNWRKVTHAMQVHEEVHITVAGGDASHVLRWQSVCASLGMKPLWIELNTFDRQLMCAARSGAPTALAAEITRRGFDVVRIKYEVQPYQVDVSTHEKPNQVLQLPRPDQTIYYECHVKFDGPFRPWLPLASRDLFRDQRWYVTHRQIEPFDYMPFLKRAVHEASSRNTRNAGSIYAGHEYEACLLDSNPDLDKLWTL